MKRFVNMRTFGVVALSETIIILILYIFGINRIVGIILGIIYYLSLLITGVACFKTSKMKLAAALVICFILGAATHICYEVRLNTFNNVSVENGAECTVEGSIDTIATDGSKVVSITISDAAIDGKSANGKICVIFEEDDVLPEYVSIGNKFKASGKIYAVKLVNGAHVDGDTYRKNVRYEVYAAFSSAETQKHKAGIFTRVRAALYKRLISACGYKYGSVAYCMLTGDKSELDVTTYKLYSMSGIAHVLAVSGLHVGFIAAMLGFVLGKLKVRKTVRVISITAILALYAVFVGMSASVIRACIMCVIGLCTLINGQRKDALSSLCFAYSVILTAEPFLLFEVGFLLSFTAVFGLILFTRTFEKYMRKIHIPKFVAAPLAATFAVHIGILPVSIYFFGAVQTYSILFNLLLVPLISVTFVLMVIVAPISVIFGFNVLLNVAASGFAVADLFIGAVQYLPFVSLYVCSHKALFLLYPAYFASSRFFMLPKLKKTSSLIIFAMCAVIIIAPTLAGLKFSNKIQNSIIPVNGYGDVTSVIIDEEVTVLGDLKDFTALKSILKSNNIRNIDTIILNKLTKSIGNELSDFVRDYKVGKIVCPVDCIDGEGLAELGKYKRFYTFEECELSKVTQVYSGSRHAGFLYEFFDDISFLSVGYSSQYTRLSDEIINSSLIIRCFMYLNYAPDRVYLTDMPKGYLDETPKYQFTYADCGNYIYKVFTGEILKQK